MALFNFGKKSQGSAPAQYNPQPGSGLPVDQVMMMRQQGLTNNQIVQTLQRDGFDSARIFDALSQADLQTGAPQQGYQEMQMQQPMPQEQGYDQGQQYPSQAMFGGERERIEEMAETIIDEKWDELIKNINKIVDWKDKTEARLLKNEQEMKDLKESFDKLHKALIGKIAEYDQNILNVGTEIKAMEKVFQQILPTFTENVSELSRITKGIKKRP
ncbi:MAG: hypothetical protein V1837_02430 [Candidatus Woesearchaeota archaeon]